MSEFRGIFELGKFFHQKVIFINAINFEFSEEILGQNYSAISIFDQMY